ALICDNPSPYYVYEMQSGIRDRCAADGVRMIAQPYDRDSPDLLDDIESLIETISVDGLILTPPVTDYPHVLDLLQRRGVRFVRISPGTQADLTPSVFLDNEAGALEMTRHLVSLGHRRIAFVAGHKSYATSAQRMSGYLHGLREAGVDLDLALVKQGTYDFASGSAAAEELLALDRPPSAIFASNDEMAAGVLAVAHRLDMDVPDALSVAGFGDDAVASVVWPPLSTIRQPTRRLGYEAAALLLGDAAAPVERRELPFELIVRGSTGRASG
nr:substrate-binding domain-containing protein [Pseudomonadota bacterium]